MNGRQKAFADYYIECGNAAEAARKAGYSVNTARQMGKENLTKPYISGDIGLVKTVYCWHIEPNKT